MATLILKSNGTQGGGVTRESGEEAPKRMERTEAAVVEILGEAAALKLLKILFYEAPPFPDCSTNSCFVVVVVVFPPLRVVLVSKVNPSRFRQVPPFRFFLLRPIL